MDDVFDDAFSEPEEGKGDPQQPAQQPQQAEAQQPAGEQQPQQPVEPGAVPPAAGEQEAQVPRSALEAVRKDWKEKAVRAETERDLARQELEQLRRAQQQPQQPQDPVQTLQQLVLNERFNVSEMFVRENPDRYPNVDDVIGAFKEAAAQNPALVAQMHAHPQPWKFAYEEGKRLRFAAEIGNDPAAYRKRIEDEVRAELQKSQPAAAAPAAAPIPQSLAGARSAGARGNAFTGPTPMDDIFH